MSSPFGGRPNPFGRPNFGVVSAPGGVGGAGGAGEASSSAAASASHSTPAATPALATSPFSSASFGSFSSSLPSSSSWPGPQQPQQTTTPPVAPLFQLQPPTIGRLAAAAAAASPPGAPPRPLGVFSVGTGRVLGRNRSSSSTSTSSSSSPQTASASTSAQSSLDCAGPVKESPLERRAAALTDALTCGLCLEQYSDETGKHMPLSLPCGHTFCLKCVGSLQSKCCPNDRTKFASVSALPRNYAVLEILRVPPPASASAPDSAPSLAVQALRRLSTAELEAELEARRQLDAQIKEIAESLEAQSKVLSDLSVAKEETASTLRERQKAQSRATYELDAVIAQRVAEISRELRVCAEPTMQRLASELAAAEQAFAASEAALQRQELVLLDLDKRRQVLLSTSGGESQQDA